MLSSSISFSRPQLVGNEHAYIDRATSGAGLGSSELEQVIAATYPAVEAVACAASATR